MTMRDTSLPWILILSAASVATSWALACAAPFAALAALAAMRLGRRDGILLMFVAWFASQAVGFGIHHYPRDMTTILWGGAIGVAAIASILAARWSARRAHGGAASRMALAYLGATAGYKAMLVLSSVALGGLRTALSPVYFAQGLVLDGAILLALLVVYRGLVALGVPAAAGDRPAIA